MRQGLLLQLWEYWVFVHWCSAVVELLFRMNGQITFSLAHTWHDAICSMTCLSGRIFFLLPPYLPTDKYNCFYEVRARFETKLLFDPDRSVLKADSSPAALGFHQHRFEIWSGANVTWRYILAFSLSLDKLCNLIHNNRGGIFLNFNANFLNLLKQITITINNY